MSSDREKARVKQRVAEAATAAADTPVAAFPPPSLSHSSSAASRIRPPRQKLQRFTPRRQPCQEHHRVTAARQTRPDSLDDNAGRLRQPKDVRQLYYNICRHCRGRLGSSTHRSCRVLQGSRTTVGACLVEATHVRHMRECNVGPDSALLSAMPHY